MNKILLFLVLLLSYFSGFSQSEITENELNDHILFLASEKNAHVSFYKAGMPVLGIHTDAHPQYHIPEDIADLINITGEKKVSDYIYAALMEFATTDYKMEFIPQD